MTLYVSLFLLVSSRLQWLAASVHFVAGLHNASVYLLHMTVWSGLACAELVCAMVTTVGLLAGCVLQ